MAMLAGSEAQGTVALKAFMPVCSLMSCTLKWSRTIEEPTNASSMSSRDCISRIVRAATVSVWIR